MDGAMVFGVPQTCGLALHNPRQLPEAPELWSCAEVRARRARRHNPLGIRETAPSCEKIVSALLFVPPEIWRLRVTMQNIEARPTSLTKRRCGIIYGPPRDGRQYAPSVRSRTCRHDQVDDLRARLPNVFTG